MAKDRRIHDGEQLVLGDTTVTMNVTPGHTHGTISPTFEVRQGGQRHQVLLWGGTAFNFGKDVPRLQSYIDAADRMADIAAKQGIDVMISNHSGYDDSLRKMEALRRGTAQNPFIIGNDAVVRGPKAMESCAKAQRDRFVMS